MKTEKLLPLFTATIAGLFAAIQPALVAGQEKTEDTGIRGVRRVAGQVLTSTEVPAVHLKLGESFKYVGHQSFILYGIAHAEQHFFVDADEQGRIKRLYWIQFEGYLPSNSYSYQYKITKQVTLGSLTFIADTFARNAIDEKKNRPESDLAKAEAFLESKGYRIKRDDVVLQRLVHLIGEARRDELMIIYAEDSGTQGMSVSDLSERILERAAANIAISR